MNLCSIILALLLLLAPCGLVAADSARDTRAEPDAASSDNLAYQKPYRLSSVPTVQYYHLFKEKGQALPDMNTALTDGVVCKSKYFWVSPLCLNFTCSSIDVVIDLGKVYPIEEIFSHHGSNLSAGVAQPRREAYFTSLDNVHFVPVGQCRNDFDPRGITERNKKDHFSGLKTFQSGKLKTKGRYVLVRTSSIRDNPENPGLVMSGYLGHDEIIVKKGNFSADDVKLDLKKAVKTSIDANDSLTGYPFHTKNWQTIFSRTPLTYLLVPHGFRGAKTYHMSVGGVYALEFFAQDYSATKPRNITFRCSFPDSVEIIDSNRILKTVSKKKEQIDGVAYTTLVQTIDEAKFLRTPNFVVAPKPTKPNDNLGSIQFDWHYNQDGKTYTSETQRYQIVLEPKLTAPSPKRFKTGFWAPQSNKCLTHDYETSKRLFEFYQDIGFNWISGGHSNPGIFRAVNEVGIDACFEKSVLSNTFQPAKFSDSLKTTLAKEIPFVFADGKQKLYGVCPTKFLSGKYDRQYIDHIKSALATTRDIYDNWEPYQFKKKGCVCEQCKEAFMVFSDQPKSEVDKLWPAVVTDWESSSHNDFFSSQIAGMIQKTQACMDEAAKEMNLDHAPSFIPSLSPRYLNPKHDWYRAHQPKFFLPKTRELIVWDYSNGVNPFVFSKEDMMGNNLRLMPQLQNVLAARETFGHRDAQGNLLPKLYFLQTQFYFGTMLVLPKDYYFGSVLAFVMGFDGYGTWQETHQQEARYLRQQARANTFISRYENVVLDGELEAGFSVRQAGPKTSGTSLLVCRAFRHEGKRYVAVGNDSLFKTRAILSSADHSTGSLVDEKGRSSRSGNLRDGITVTLPGKSWLMFTVSD